MKRILISALVLALIPALPGASAQDTAKPALKSGINLQNFDKNVRPQDDFYQYVNGGWINKTEIPADKSSWGTGAELNDTVLGQLHTIVENAQKAAPGTEARKIGDFYASFMNEAKLDNLGLTPLKAELAHADKMKKSDIPARIAHYNRIGATAPYDIQIHQDNKDSTKYIVDIGQTALGMPDRDYYLKEDDAKLMETRAKYQAHVEKMLGLAGYKSAAEDAKNIVALETALAKVQWTKVENRDPIKAYNKVMIADLAKLAPDYDWKAYLAAAGLADKVSYVIVSQPSYLTGFNQILKETPAGTWQAYFRWHVLSSYAPFLAKPFANENFAFYGTVLRGIPQQEVRWKRAVKLVDSNIGEALGKLYVTQYFPPENKARMEKLVRNLITAMEGDIGTLDWMGPETRKEAKAKLATFTLKIGYTDRWRDYSSLKFTADDLAGNVMRGTEFEYQRNIAKLGKPIDRTEWGMTPQTIDAYYNPEMNEIVFPAAILQPPFFDVNADDAVNYGSIGMVIGHEISHGFDDQGSQYDGAGNLRDWWTADDHEHFKAKTAILVKHYNSFSPIPNYNVNGELTLGENIGDNSGAAIAYKAYHLSLAGKEAPVLDGLTGDQRFYLGYAQVWRNKMRDAQMIVRIKSDPHSPPKFRVNGVMRNQPAFYDAFGVKEGDKMYLPPAERALIW